MTYPVVRRQLCVCVRELRVVFVGSRQFCYTLSSPYADKTSTQNGRTVVGSRASKGSTYLNKWLIAMKSAAQGTDSKALVRHSTPSSRKRRRVSTRSRTWRVSRNLTDQTPCVRTLVRYTLGASFA